jgi:hypothetical protein
MWVAVSTVKGQKKSRRLALINMAWAILQIVRLVRSATPFWGGESGIVFKMGRPGVEISFRRRSKVCLRCMIFGVDGSGGGTVCSDVGGLGLVDGRCAQLSGCWMRFGWYVVFFGTLRFGEVDVPRATPPTTLSDKACQIR